MKRDPNTVLQEEGIDALRAASDHCAHDNDNDAGSEHAGWSSRANEQSSDEITRPPMFSDEALALEFAEAHVNRLRYVASENNWYRWNGKHWAEDRTLLAFSLVREVCRKASVTCNDGRLGKALASGGTVAAVERLAKSDRRLAAEVAQFDTDPMLLNTPSGVVNLRTGEVRCHNPQEYMKLMTAVGPTGECPLWLTFLHRVCGGDCDLIRYLQRVAGYTLTGSTREHALFFLHGIGANGKSVFIGTISGLLGTYHKVAPIEAFTASKLDRHPTELAGLMGARLVTAVETEEGQPWAEARIKSLTGGDKITARKMRQDFMEFTPFFKLLIAGNHKPTLRSVDEAIRRRFHLIPFTAAIPPQERDEELPEKLKAEWPGILQWAVQGCLEWQRLGLYAPEIVKAATAEYLDTQNVLAQWIEAKCEREPAHEEGVTKVYEAWLVYAKDVGEEPGSQKAFAGRMEKEGIVRGRKATGMVFKGIRLRQYYDD